VELERRGIESAWNFQFIPWITLPMGMTNDEGECRKMMKEVKEGIYEVQRA
jgi:hypothetical protein